MATLRKRTLPSGAVVWQADYRDGDGKRRHKQFGKKGEADAFLKAVYGELRAGTHVAESQSKTFAEVATLWLTKAESDGLERATVARYSGTYNVYVKPAFGGTKLTAIKRPAIQTFIDGLQGQMSTSSLKKVRDCLRQVFSFAVKRGLVGSNPVTDIDLPFRKRGGDADPIEMPTKDEIRRIIAAAPAGWQPYLKIAVLSGLRASEQRGMTWGDVDLERGVIHITRRVDRYGEYGPPKSEAGRRHVPLSPASVDMLSELKASRPNAGPEDLVFPNKVGGFLDHQNILNRVFKPAQMKAGVTVDTGKKDKDGQPIMAPKFGLHALRHAAAALFIEQGLNPKRIQVLMGHSSIQVTYDIYGYIFPKADDDRDAMASIGANLFT